MKRIYKRQVSDHPLYAETTRTATTRGPMDLTVNALLEDDFPLQPLDSLDSDHTSRTETLEQDEGDEEDEEPLITKEDEALITILAVDGSQVWDSPVDESPLDTGRGSISTTIKKAAASMTKSQWKRIFTAVATLIAYMFLTAGISMIAPFYPIVVSCIRNVPSPPPTPPFSSPTPPFSSPHPPPSSPHPTPCIQTKYSRTSLIQTSL